MEGKTLFFAPFYNYFVRFKCKARAEVSVVLFNCGSASKCHAEAQNHISKGHISAYAANFSHHIFQIEALIT